MVPGRTRIFRKRPIQNRPAAPPRAEIESGRDSTSWSAAAITKTDIFDFLVDIVPRDDFKEDGMNVPRAPPAAVALGAPGGGDGQGGAGQAGVGSMMLSLSGQIEGLTWEVFCQAYICGARVAFHPF